MQYDENAIITQLTPSELIVVEEVAKGLSNQAVATALGKSQRTIESHVSNILSKTGLKNRTQLTLWYITGKA
jgi:DNA-binding NarL/FixJ family response regulator